MVVFDNRDCGLSTKFDGQLVDMGLIVGAMLTGDEAPVKAVAPYTLSDMSDDAFAVLDHLGIERAHIVGASMGGMIVQTMAIEHPARVLSLTSIMSMTGELGFGESTPEAQLALLSPAPLDREGNIERAESWRAWTSKRYSNIDDMKRRAAEGFDRSFYPEGSQRQLAAIVASGSRKDALEQLSVPTLVVHGLDDNLIGPSGGQRTADLVPGANLLLVKDMGHDLPEPLWPLLVSSIIGHSNLALAPR